MPKATINRLLSRLPPHDFDLLAPHLTPVDLPLRKRLETPDQAIEHVYFPESGFASVVSAGVGADQVEIGIIGREGMTGLAVVLGTDRTPNGTFIQNAGTGFMMAAAELRRLMKISVPLHDLLMLYAHTFLIQATQCMRRCPQYEAVSGKASSIPLVDLAVRLENQAYNSIFAPGSIRRAPRLRSFAIDFQFPPRRERRLLQSVFRAESLISMTPSPNAPRLLLVKASVRRFENSRNVEVPLLVSVPRTF